MARGACRRSLSGFASIDGISSGVWEGKSIVVDQTWIAIQSRATALHSRRCAHRASTPRAHRLMIYAAVSGDVAPARPSLAWPDAVS